MSKKLGLADWAQIWFGLGILSENRQKYPADCVLDFCLQLHYCGALTPEGSNALFEEMEREVLAMPNDEPALKSSVELIPKVLRTLYANAVNQHVLSVVDDARKKVRHNPNLN